MPSIKTKYNLVDTFSVPEGTWELFEGNEGSVVDGQIYLARLKGPMALVNGTSSNGRFYSDTLWETQLKQIRERLKDDGMFGVCGHNQELDEEAISSGKFSHKIVNLHINEATKTLDGELLVLNSSAGRELNVLIRSGKKISVSTRAYGKTKGKTSDGAEIIDEANFYMETIDVVNTPGVGSASPRLVESVETPEKEDQQMTDDKALYESLTKKAELQVELNESIRKHDEASRQLNEALKDKNEAQEKLQKAQKVIGYFAKNFGPKPVQALVELNEGIAKWMMVPELQELAKEVGLFDGNGMTMDQTIKKLVESVKTYGKLGTSEKVKAELAQLAKYREAGSTPEVVHTGADLLESFMKLDKDPTELSKKLESAEKVIKLYREARYKVATKKICEAFAKKGHKLDEAVVTKLIKTLPLKEAISSLKSLTGGVKKIAEKENKDRLGKNSDKPIPVPATKLTAAGDCRNSKLFESTEKNWIPVATK